MTAPFAAVVDLRDGHAGRRQPGRRASVRAGGAGRAGGGGGPAGSGFQATEPGDAAMLTALNSGTRIPAIVTQRAAMLDPQTGLVDVTLAPQGAVLLGEPVALTITAGSVTGDPVPRDAVLEDAQGDYVFQLNSRGIAHREQVQGTGGRRGDERARPRSRSRAAARHRRRVPA